MTEDQAMEEEEEQENGKKDQEKKGRKELSSEYNRHFPTDIKDKASERS